MIKISIILFHLLFAACNENPVDNNNQSPENNTNSITLLPEEEYQLIHGFGASDAWSCQFVGKNWPENKKNQIADLLFSKENDPNGNPKGIGLSVWRFNIGGGSAEQGAESDITDKWRRAECFLGTDGQLDWTKQSGQSWFLKAAKERGVETFISFLNSPPVAISKNRKAYSSSPDSYNLSPDNYSKHVNFIADVLTHFKNEKGIEFNYISPFNEPQWDWMKPTQEGSPAKNAEIASISRLLNNELGKRNILTKIEIPETAQINYLFETGNKANRGDQVYAFFNSDSEYYLGNLSHIGHKVAAHSYFTTWDSNKMKETREKVHQKINEIDSGLEYWMTEYCILENNEEIKGNGRDLGMKPALYVARVIHADLTIANASSWQWWLAVSPYDYKDGLVYIDKNETDGKIYDSKILWVLGNYSRFIRPGMRRIETQINNQTGRSINCSAYKTENESELVFVITNYDSNDFEFELKIENIENYTIKSYITSFKTSDNLSLSQDLIKENLTCPASSVVTFVLKEVIKS